LAAEEGVGIIIIMVDPEALVAGVEVVKQIQLALGRLVAQAHLDKEILGVEEGRDPVQFIGVVVVEVVQVLPAKMPQTLVGGEMEEME
jgi:hypothetical protein